MQGDLYKIVTDFSLDGLEHKVNQLMEKHEWMPQGGIVEIEEDYIMYCQVLYRYPRVRPTPQVIG